MFRTLLQVSPHEPLDYDLCIIGAGAAGLTIANKLKDAGLRICLVEGGGLESGSDSQAIYRGVSQGYADLLASRQRFFGGTTNHWSGYCRPPDEQDLNARPWEPLSGWPLSTGELGRYLPEALDIVEIPNQFDPAYWAKKRGAVPLNLKSTDFRERVSLVGPPVRFREKYRSVIDQSRAVVCLLETSVVELLPSAAGTRIEEVTIKTLDGTALPLRAKVFVLACGGIENARVLLNSNSRIAAGVGNANDLVGRYFADHCLRVSGSAVFTRPPETPLIYELGPIFEPSTKIHPHVQTDVSFAATRQLSRVIIRFQLDTPSRVTRLIEKVAGFWDGTVSRTFRIETFVEPLPLAENRITLLDERDRLGLRRIKLAYRPSDVETRAVRETLKRFAAVVGAAGKGRVHVDDEAIDAPPSRWGCHHFGTTRMHPDPKQGVVDTDGRVHGIQNLFVAGSSVFPTAGVMTPTLTIVTLALRLADRLKGVLNA